MSPGISLTSKLKLKAAPIVFISAILAIFAMTSFIPHRNTHSRQPGTLAVETWTDSVLRVQSKVSEDSNQTLSIKHLKNLINKAEEQSNKK